MGWNRKVLRVNLTAGTCTPEPLNMKWADDSSAPAVGFEIPGFGKSTPKVDPLSPDNKIMSTGRSPAPWPPPGPLHGGHQRAP